MLKKKGTFLENKEKVRELIENKARSQFLIRDMERKQVLAAVIINWSFIGKHFPFQL